jgi:hypothetical protein
MERIKAVESSTDLLKSQVTKVEVASKEARGTARALADLNVRVQAIEEDDNDQQMRFKALDKDRNDRIEKQESMSTATDKKLRTLETLYHALSKERQELMRKDDETILTRLANLENAIQILTARIVSEQSKINDSHTDVRLMNQQMVQLESNRKEDRDEIIALLKRLKRLEKANVGTERLQINLRNASLRHNLQQAHQPPGLEMSSPPVGQVQVPSSPLAKRMIETENLGGPVAKRQTQGPPRLAMIAITEPTTTKANESVLEVMGSNILTKPSQRYRT